MPIDDALALARRHLKNGDLGFMATAVSPWHALGVDSWVEDMRSRGMMARGVIALQPHTKSGLLVSPANFPFSTRDPRTTIAESARPDARGSGRGGRRRHVVDALRFVVQQYLSLAAPRSARLRVVTPRSLGVSLAADLVRDLDRRRPRLEFVVIDEGVGSYMTRRVNELEVRVTAGGPPVGPRGRGLAWARNEALHAARAMLAPFACRRMLFDVANGALVANPTLKRQYVRTLRRLFENVPSGSFAPASGRSVLLVTQPWSELGEIDPADEADVITSVVSDYLALGYEVRIKAHPRERSDKYRQVGGVLASDGVEHLDPSVPVEVAFFDETRGQLTVAGASSTSLITASALFDLPAHSFGQLMAARKSAGNYLRAHVTAFERLAANYVREVPSRIGAGRVAR